MPAPCRASASQPSASGQAKRTSGTRQAESCAVCSIGFERREAVGRGDRAWNGSKLGRRGARRAKRGASAPVAALRRERAGSHHQITGTRARALTTPAQAEAHGACGERRGGGTKIEPEAQALFVANSLDARRSRPAWPRAPLADPGAAMSLRPLLAELAARTREPRRWQRGGGAAGLTARVRGGVNAAESLRNPARNRPTTLGRPRRGRGLAVWAHLSAP